MDNLSYLNQISSTTPRASGQANSGLLSPMLKKVLIIAGSVLVVLIIGGIILRSLTGSHAVDLSRLELRITTLKSTIGTYQPSVKSTSVRANSSSLSSVLDGMLVSIAGLEGDGSPSPSDAAVSEESAYALSLDSTLTHAKLTGSLDRVYAYQFAYEIEVLLSMLSELYARSSDATERSFLKSSYDSLELLLPTFQAFSSAS